MSNDDHVRRTANIHSNIPSEIENSHNINHTEKKHQFLQSKTSVEPKTNPTDITQQNP